MPATAPVTLIPIHSGLYPDRVTLQAKTDTQNSYGEPIPAWANVSGLADLPCRVVPASFAERLQITERRKPDRTELTEMVRVAIPQHLPQISTAMQAVISSVSWNVLAAEASAHLSLTRLLLERVSL